MGSWNCKTFSLPPIFLSQIFLSPSPSPPPLGFPRGRISRFAPPNFNGVGGFALASFGGEVGDEEVPYLQASGRFMGRRVPIGNSVGSGRTSADFNFLQYPKLPKA